MEENIHRQVEHVIHCRRQLASVEARRAKFQQDVPADIWEEFIDVTRQLDKAEELVRLSCRNLVDNVNLLRGKIINKLDEYNLWRKQLRQIEEQFLLNIIRPGYQLKLAIQQRKKLEQEYLRIHEKIQHEGYNNQGELESDIHQVLAYDDAASEIQEEIPDETLEQEEALYDVLTRTDVDDVVDVINREELLKEFKRVVMPKIHPDTSDTPDEEFITVYEAFKKQDPLLMEAYIAEYRGEIQANEEDDVLSNLEQANSFWKRYQQLIIRLERRFERLLKDITKQELENPAKLIEKFSEQRKEIIARIQSEADQIIYWREKIEGLPREYNEHNPPEGQP